MAPLGPFHLPYLQRSTSSFCLSLPGVALGLGGPGLRLPEALGAPELGVRRRDAAAAAPWTGPGQHLMHLQDQLPHHGGCPLPAGTVFRGASREALVPSARPGEPPGQRPVGQRDPGGDATADAEPQALSGMGTTPLLLGASWVRSCVRRSGDCGTVAVPGDGRKYSVSSVFWGVGKEVNRFSCLSIMSQICKM